MVEEKTLKELRKEERAKIRAERAVRRANRAKRLVEQETIDENDKSKS